MADAPKKSSMTGKLGSMAGGMAKSAAKGAAASALGGVAAAKAKEIGNHVMKDEGVVGTLKKIEDHATKSAVDAISAKVGGGTIGKLVADAVVKDAKDKAKKDPKGTLGMMASAAAAGAKK
eukprot:m.336061 g.336061  ORF g.336061 m.336061 type:complete len:121 (+) comp17745_c0_seq1:202-564(+)